ncbi:MAG: glutamate formimidoyltransferase [Bacteroidia bacterium]|nr:glutamate formimidoyltransferase [Bacteroidia bacterium]
MQLIECVPNFSEGNDLTIIKQITNAIESVEGIKLLNVDPGKATNRTVVTFVGEPIQVIEAAYRGISKAKELINMRMHTGEHPRMGATDVCPLIPIANITMEETARYAKQLAERVGNDLSIAVYLYEAAQTKKERNNLSVIRAGEYEGFFKKITLPEWKPDFGPTEHHITAGSTVIGARDFLVAFNINLNTTSVRRANSIAFDVREAGRVKREGNPITGKIVTDENGKPVSVAGTLKSVKAIGWFIEEYGVAQISMNLTNVNVTPVHVAFDEVCAKAQARGIRVTGSELVGVIPLKSLTDAGKYFLEKQQRSLGVSEQELIRIAVKSMGLDALGPFNAQERIIEYMLNAGKNAPLVKMNLVAFANETASESPAPGGGSIAAYMGALAASLGAMVANLSSHKAGWDERWKEFSNHATLGQELKDKLLNLVDEDTNSFNQIMNAFAMPKNSDEEKTQRTQAIQAATKHAIDVPMETLKASFATFALAEAMIKTGNPNSVTDAGVAVLAARAAVIGAYFNIKVNASSYNDKPYVNAIIAEATNYVTLAKAKEEELTALVEEKISI